MNVLGVVKAFLNAPHGAEEALAAAALADLFEEAGDAAFANQLRDRGTHAWLLHPNHSDVLWGEESDEQIKTSLRHDRHEFRCARDVLMFRSTMYNAREWFGRDDDMLVADTIDEAVDYLKENM